MLNAVRRGQHRPVLDEAYAVFAGGQTLHFPHLAVVAGLAQPDVAGVNQRQHAVVIHGAAGKATVLVIGRIGCQGDGLVLPADQIAAGRVPPVHGPPVFAIGVMLEEGMIDAVNTDQAVGIVDPAGGRREMELRVVIISALCAQGLDRMVGLS